jgi:hypothetical protein
MAFLSKNKHERFKAAAEKIIDNFGEAENVSTTRVNELDNLRSDIHFLNDLYIKYTDRLNEMRLLINQYFETQRRIRFRLKHQQKLLFEKHNNT